MTKTTAHYRNLAQTASNCGLWAKAANYWSKAIKAYPERFKGHAIYKIDVDKMEAKRQAALQMAGQQ
jgi:hypothetical protein